MTPRELKSQLRAKARAARCALDSASCALGAESAAEHLLSLPELRAAHVVMAYSATAEELDPAPVVEALHGAGKVVVLPRIDSPGVLDLHAFAHGDELEPGPMGILEPSADSPQVSPDALDVVIVPGVAFDEAGRRLGYGGGYYDRLLRRLRADAVRVGFAFDEQVVDEIPVAEHDEHVNAIVTPTRVIRVERAR